MSDETLEVLVYTVVLGFLFAVGVVAVAVFG